MPPTPIFTQPRSRSGDRTVAERLEFEHRRAEYLATPVTEEEMQDRRPQEQMADTEYLADVESLSGLPMNEGRGGVLTALGYHGSPGSDEGQVSISHYAYPMGYGSSLVLGSYIPRMYGSLSPEDQKSVIAKHYKNFTFYGDPPPVSGVALGATGQDDMRRYGDTFRHESRHRGMDSLAWERLWEESRTEGNLSLQYQMNRVKGEQEAIFKTIRQLQQGELTYEELSEEERERLDAFKDVEQALLDSLTEEERLKLGLFERKPPADPPNPNDPVEMPEEYRAGGRVRLI